MQLHNFRTINFIFSNAKEIRARVKETRHDRARAKLQIKPSNKSTNDPTASAAIRNLTPLRYITLDDNRRVYNPEAWIRVVDSTYSQLDSIARQISHLKFDSNMSISEICDSLKISRGFYFLEMTKFHEIAKKFLKKYLTK